MSSLETIIMEVQGSNVLLFILLILLFVIGYKLLQTVIRIGLIAVLSGLFLIALNTVGVGPAVTLDRFILFMVLGTGLFILYSGIATLYALIRHTTDFTTDLMTWAFKPVRTEQSMWSRTKQHVNRWRHEWKQTRNRRSPDTEESEPEDSKEKAIILGEVDEE